MRREPARPRWRGRKCARPLYGQASTFDDALIDVKSMLPVPALSSKKRRVNCLEIKANFQKVRHAAYSDVFRKLTYRALVGEAEWPPTFRAPECPRVRPFPSNNVYVHLPFCQTLCPHCPYNKVKADANLITAYHSALLSEITEYTERADVLPVRSLYFGGGTPSLTPEVVADVISRFRPFLCDDAEVAIEVYPTHATPEFLKELRNLGVNRISLGVESLDPKMLKRLGRCYRTADALRAIELSKIGGFNLVDVNLIFGIPDQGVQEFLDGVTACIAAGADQISAYPLFTFDHTPAGTGDHQDRYARADDVKRLRMQRGVSRIAQEAGLLRTSVWSYTRAGLTPYTTVTRPHYIGFGAGAGSKMNGFALFNTFSVEAYIAASPYATALTYRLSKGQKKADWLYWQLYNTRIDTAGYRASYGVPLEHDYGRLLRFMRMIRFLRKQGDIYELTETGVIWVHRLQSLFSLNGIDAMWSACLKQAWPKEVAIA